MRGWEDGPPAHLQQGLIRLSQGARGGQRRRGNKGYLISRLLFKGFD